MAPIEEWIEVLTPAGEPAGGRKRKSEVHRDGDWHRAAHLWLLTPDGRVLLQRRSLAKENHPGLWDVSVAGHVSAGETAVEAAVREAEEEIGLALRAEELRHVATIAEESVLRGGTYIDREHHEVFVCRRELDLGALKLQEDEVDEVALVTLAEFRARVRGGDPSLVPHPGEYELLLRNDFSRPA